MIPLEPILCVGSRALAGLVLLWADDADAMTKHTPPDLADWRDFGMILINDLDTLALAAEIPVRETSGKAPEMSVPVGAAVHCA